MLTIKSTIQKQAPCLPFLFSIPSLFLEDSAVCTGESTYPTHEDMAKRGWAARTDCTLRISHVLPHLC